MQFSQTRHTPNPKVRSCRKLDNGVLVVDDSERHRYEIISWLNSQNISKIYEAADGASALRLIKSLPAMPDVVILDLEMPGMDGVEFLQVLEEKDLRPAIIIVTSADDILIGSVATMIEAMGFKLLGSYQKPCSRELIEEALNRYFDDLKGQGIIGDLVNTSVDYDLLKQAIQSSTICPYYQPKMDLKTGKCVGVEALARWWDPKGNPISPTDFIPLAEKFDLIDELTIALVNRILMDIEYWKLNKHNIPVSVNISPLSLKNRKFISFLINLVETNRISPKMITFEITEGRLVENLSETLANTNRLRLKNFSFSIDDFGTGFSSMEKLSLFPFTELKIDQHFVKTGLDNSKSFEMLGAFIAMGKKLGITTVAEGVENIDQLCMLKELGCDQIQGNYPGKPMSAQFLISWIIYRDD